jgi:hypothetical protein
MDEQHFDPGHQPVKENPRAASDHRRAPLAFAGMLESVRAPSGILLCKRQAVTDEAPVGAQAVAGRQKINRFDKIGF